MEPGPSCSHQEEAPSDPPRYSLPAVLSLRTIFILIVALAQTARARRLPDIYWNSTNPIFRVDNTDHVLGVKIRDRLSFVCPYFDPDSLFTQSDLEYSKIYRVSKWSYDSCELGEDARLVGICQTPHQRAQIGVVFREFTPVPGGLEYRPGQAYYFVSTSNGSLSGMGNTQGGLCTRNNVKIKIEVQSTEDWAEPDAVWRGGGLGDGARFPSPPPSPTPSPTPLMYIIHTRAPEDARRPRDGYQVGGATGDVVAEEDDDGGAGSIRLSSLLLFLSSILLLPLHLLPELWH